MIEPRIVLTFSYRGLIRRKSRLVSSRFIGRCRRSSSKHSAGYIHRTSAAGDDRYVRSATAPLAGSSVSGVRPYPWHDPGMNDKLRGEPAIISQCEDILVEPHLSCQGYYTNIAAFSLSSTTPARAPPKWRKAARTTQRHAYCCGCRGGEGMETIGKTEIAFRCTYPARCANHSYTWLGVCDGSSHGPSLECLRLR